MITLNCANCGAETQKWAGHIKEANFCSSKCYGEYQSKTKAPMTEYVCKQCGILFSKPAKKGRTNRFCSKDCSIQYRVENRNLQICERCGAEFFCAPASKRKFCSRSCSAKTQSIQVDLVCEYCGVAYTRAPCVAKRKEHNYCSKECGYKANNHRQSKDCLTCGKSFEYRPSRAVAKYCSYECSKLYFVHHPKSIKRQKRSKVEAQFAHELQSRFPSLVFEYNNRALLGGLEIDILIPELNLGIDWRGYFYHYGPWSEKKGAIERDNRREVLSSQNGIELIVYIDKTSDNAAIEEALSLVCPRIQERLT